MEEIPTAVVDPLPPGVDKGYPVLNRPYAFVQWVQKHMDQIPEDYILMAEPDHIFVRPPPLWCVIPCLFRVELKPVLVLCNTAIQLPLSAQRENCLGLKD